MFYSVHEKLTIIVDKQVRKMPRGLKITNFLNTFLCVFEEAWKPSIEKLYLEFLGIYYYFEIFGTYF